MTRFQNLDTELYECIMSAAKTVAKKKFGYQRSPALSDPSLVLNFWKAVHSTKKRKVRIGSKQIEQAATCAIDRVN